MRWQRTLARPIRLSGLGLHSGAPVDVQVSPARENTGVVLRLVDQLRSDAASTDVRASMRAHIGNVDAASSQLCTQLRASDSHHRVSTVEHLMAALTAFGVSNACVDVAGEGDAVELPILDGSSLQFMDELLAAGLSEQTNAPLRFLRVAKPVQVLMEDKAAWLLPMPEDTLAAGDAAPTLRMSVQVNFHHKQLGSRECRYVLGADPAHAGAFHSQIAPARTFTFEEEIEWMHQHGLARGGSLENAVVFSGLNEEKTSRRVLNAEGLRFEDEWVRHKLLDCVGDLGLVGLPLHGFFFATSPGHALTHALLRELFSDTSNYKEIECTGA